MRRGLIIVLFLIFGEFTLTGLAFGANPASGSGSIKYVAVSIVLDNGKVIQKKIEISDGRHGLIVIGKNFGPVSGAFDLLLRLGQKGHEFELRVLGRVYSGVVKGIVKSFLVGKKGASLITAGEYENNRKNGRSTAYFPYIGRVRFVGNFKDGERDGHFVYLYVTGRKAAEIDYRSGKMDGRCVVFDEKGGVIASGEYKSGVPYAGTCLARTDLFLHDLTMARSRKYGVLRYDRGRPVEAASSAQK